MSNKNVFVERDNSCFYWILGEFEEKMLYWDLFWMQMCCLGQSKLIPEISSEQESLFALHLVIAVLQVIIQIVSISMTVLDWRVSDDALSGGLERGYV